MYLDQSELDAIYADFLKGSNVAELAKAYRHRRCTIEEALREKAQCEKTLCNIKAERQQRICRALTDERDHLHAAAITWQYTILCKCRGKKAARKWFRDYRSSLDALKAKERVLRGLVRAVYDAKGLLVDFVPQSVDMGAANNE